MPTSSSPFTASCAAVPALIVLGMIRDTRAIRMFLSLTLLLGVFLAIEPRTPVEAARPVCATSSKAKFERPKVGSRDRSRYVWARVCVENQEAKISVRQKNFGYREYVEATVDAHVKVVVYSMSTGGKYLRTIAFEDTVWLGDLATKLASGPAGRRGVMTYMPSTPVDTIKLPELPAGTYLLEFTLLVDPAAQNPGDSTARVTTKTKQLVFKIS